MARYLIKFTKINEIKYISHLDTMRTLSRAFRRADLPLSYSKGFNPHASISSASPLSVGISSIAEYADIELDEDLKTNVVMERLNPNLPRGMRILNAIKVEVKMPAAMSSVYKALYRIVLNHNAEKEELIKIVNEILKSSEIKIIKKTKSGEKLTDIRPLINNISILDIDKENVTFNCLVSAGSRGNLNPEALCNIIKNSSSGKIYGFPDITRIEMYADINGEPVSLLEFFSRV
jgi:radical SAM-linked protein